jgi:hypothetical protein
MTYLGCTATLLAQLPLFQVTRLDGGAFIG